MDPRGLQRSKPDPRHWVYAANARDLGVYCFGEWELVSATPPSSPLSLHQQAHPSVGTPALHVLLCCNRRAASRRCGEPGDDDRTSTHGINNTHVFGFCGAVRHMNEWVSPRRFL